jgi:RNA polymerase sigma-70 factor (ECF subfamily)
VELFPFDAEYLRRLRAADPAVEEHFAGYFSKLLTIKLRARGETRAAIHEVTQETFFRVIKAIRAPEGIQSAERLGAFVNSVCNNILHEQRRDRMRIEPLDDDYAERAPSDLDLERSLVSAESAAIVREVLDHLPEKDGRILRAIFIDERPKDEVCAEMRVDRDYLRVLLHRAKNQFRRLYLKKIDDEALRAANE